MQDRLLRRHRRSDSEGFSLVEVMVAITFLGIGLLAIAQLIPLGMAGISQARVRTIAVQTLQQRMDQVTGSGYASAAMTAGAYTETDGNYTLNWTITDSDPVPGSKRVDMTATWTTITGNQTTRLVTYLSAGR